MSSEEMLNCILSRRSVKRFRPAPVAPELLDRIIEAGIYAPSGKNTQTPVTVAITDKATRDRLSAANAAVLGSSGDPFYGAPAVLVVLAKKDWMTYLYDGSLVMGNMLLAAHALSLGGCWIHRAKEVFEMPEWREWLSSLGLGEEYEGIGNCVIGYPDMTPPDKPRLPGRVIYVK